MYKKIFGKELIKKSIPLKKIGIYDIAWKYEDVSSVLKILKNKGTGILGGDVLNINLEYTYDNWYIDVDENSNDFIDKSHQKTIEYINRYREVNGENFLYLIIFREEDWTNKIENKESYYLETENEIREILENIREIDLKERMDVEEYLENNELGIAIETLTSILESKEILITDEIYY